MNGKPTLNEAAEVEAPAGNNEEMDFEDTDGSDLFTDDDSDEELDDDTEEDTDSEEAEETDEDEGEGEEEEPDEGETENPDKGKKSKKPETTVKNVLKVIHKGVEKEIDPFSDDAKKLIQKGMDYDFKSEKLAGIEKVLTEYGRLNGGLTADDALNSLLTSVNAATEAKELTELKTKYPDAPDEVLASLAKANAKEKAITVKKTAEETETAKRLQELQAEYPQYAKLEDLPKEVQEAVAGGKSPLQAVKDNEIKELKGKLEKLEKDLAAEQQNNKNRDRSMGPAKGTAGKVNKDPFAAGLGL
jgi:hypothetical protein